jgi:hypothetical protein
MELANRHGSSRIMVRAPENRGLLLGLLNGSAGGRSLVPDSVPSTSSGIISTPLASWGSNERAFPAGFFTLGVQKDRYDLPHRPLGVPVILLIRRVICRALALLRESGFNLAEATEDQVTAALKIHDRE